MRTPIPLCRWGRGKTENIFSPTSITRPTTSNTSGPVPRLAGVDISCLMNFGFVTKSAEEDVGTGHRFLLDYKVLQVSSQAAAKFDPDVFVLALLFAATLPRRCFVTF